MRVFDGITDPICGSLMDRTATKFGKFRPFMVAGNCLLALSLILMMVAFRGLPDSMSVLRWVVYIFSYIVYVIGYTAQCACTKAGQTCLTNEAICAKGTIQYTDADGVLQTLRGAAYGAQFYNIMVPFVIILSAVYTTMAVAAIAEKDRPEFWGISEKPATFKDYLGILKGNKEIRWLVTSAGLNKLASTVATSGTVAFLVYGCLAGNNLLHDAIFPFR